MLKIFSGSSMPYTSVVLACCVVPGCGDATVNVGGTVSIDGVPVEQGMVLFRPAQGNGPTAEAVIDNGHYSLTLSPGAKRVLIQGFKVTGEVFPWGPNAPPAPVLEPVVPERYYDRSDLTVDIQTDDEALDFKLESS